MTGFRLADVAPRLAKARDQLVAERKAEARERRRLDERELHLRWLVEHRELMYLRAASSRRRGWAAERARKLELARVELAEFLAKRYPA